MGFDAGAGGSIQPIAGSYSLCLHVHADNRVTHVMRIACLFMIMELRVVAAACLRGGRCVPPSRRCLNLIDKNNSYCCAY